MSIEETTFPRLRTKRRLPSARNVLTSRFDVLPAFPIKTILIALILALSALPAFAVDITVSGSCTLVNAMAAADFDSAVGSCPAGERRRHHHLDRQQ